MSAFKRFGKIALCLLCCVACIVCAAPVSAFSAALVSTNSLTVPEAPAVSLENLASQQSAHQVSVVHRSASAGATVIGCVENGTKLTVLGTSGQFYKIDCYELDGYIAMSQVVQGEDGEYYVNCTADGGESKVMGSYGVQQAMDLKSELLQEAYKHLGAPYVWASASPSGFDCSGYTSYVFGQMGIELSRSAFEQLSQGVIISGDDLQPGDLVFYSNTGSSGGFASHVGIYIGNGQMIHSGTSTGVVIADMDMSYYTSRFLCARRVILTDVAAAASLPTMESITSSVGSSWRNDG